MRPKRAKAMKPELRQELILNTALKLSIEHGYNRVTRDGIAARAKISGASVARYFPRMKHMRFAIMDAAIQREVVEIIAQGIILNDPLTTKVTKATKQKVLSYITNLL